MMLKLHATFTYTDWQNEISQRLIRLVMFVLQVFNLLFYPIPCAAALAYSVLANNGTPLTSPYTTWQFISMSCNIYVHFVQHCWYIYSFTRSARILTFVHCYTLARFPDTSPLVFILWKFNCMMSSNYSADYFCEIEICTVIHTHMEKAGSHLWTSMTDLMAQFHRWKTTSVQCHSHIKCTL